MVKLRILNDDENDYRLLEKWYKEEEIYSHFEQRILSYDEIKNKYFPRTNADSKIPVYMIEYNNVPVGIIQYQLINDDNKKLYGLKNSNSYEIDIFIGELNLHNHGIGQQAINIMKDYLYNKQNAEVLVMCPLANNIPAIKCYEKCGFEIKKNFKTDDTIGQMQEFLLMVDSDINCLS